MNTNSRNTLISIVVPVYNEEEVLESFYEALIQVLRDINKHYEIIFVNDGSDDATEMVVTEIVTKDPGSETFPNPIIKPNTSTMVPILLSIVPGLKKVA